MKTSCFKFLFRSTLVILIFLGACFKGISQNDRILPNCPLHIIIALDFSASESAYIDELSTVLLSITDRFELHPTNFKIGIVSFNRGAQMILPLTGETEKLEETIANLRIPYNVFATDIHAGIELAYEEFSKNSIESVPKYFVLVSDGDPHAHSRGFGFQQDLLSVANLKKGNPEKEIEPVHVFTLYTGRLSPYTDRFSEDVREAAVQHMKNLASDEKSFYFFDEYPALVSFFDEMSTCF